MIMFVLSGILNLHDRQEQLAHLKALNKIPPYYVLCELDATTKSLLRDRQTLIQGTFGNREKISWPLNFYNPHLMNDAWRDEKKARKPIKLIR